MNVCEFVSVAKNFQFSYGNCAKIFSSVIRSWLWWPWVPPLWQYHWCWLQFGRHCNHFLFSWFPIDWFQRKDMLIKWKVEWTHSTVRRSVLKIKRLKQMSLSDQDSTQVCKKMSSSHLLVKQQLLDPVFVSESFSIKIRITAQGEPNCILLSVLTGEHNKLEIWGLWVHLFAHVPHKFGSLFTLDFNILVLFGQK